MPRTTATPAPAPTDTPQALLRAAHPGRWIAWSEDEGRIIAVGETPDAVRAAAQQAGQSRFIYDWVPPVEDRPTTGLG